MRFLVYALFFAAVFYGCSTANSSVKTQADFITFPAVYTAVESKLCATGLTTPDRMAIYRDSLLLVVNNLNRNPHHVTVYDITKRSAVNNVMPATRKKGGALSFMTLGVTDSLLWIFDVAKNAFVVGNMDTLVTGKRDVTAYSEYPVKPQTFYYDAMLLNRDEALLSANYDTDEKLVYVNFRDSSRNKMILSYQQDTNIGSSRINKMAYESFMLLKPDQKKLVLASRYADQFELIDPGTGKYKKVRGPLGLVPRLDPFKENTGVTVGTPGEQTVYGFLKGHVTPKYFYLLFSGYNVRSPHRFYGNKIFVYDWEGNPVKQFNLKDDIVDFSVSSDDKLLYTLNPLTRAISFSELK